MMNSLILAKSAENYIKQTFCHKQRSILECVFQSGFIRLKVQKKVLKK